MEKLAFVTLRETLRNDRLRKIKASGPPLFPLPRQVGILGLAKEGCRGGRFKIYPTGAGQVPSGTKQDYLQKFVMNQLIDKHNSCIKKWIY